MRLASADPPRPACTNGRSASASEPLASSLTTSGNSCLGLAKSAFVAANGARPRRDLPSATLFVQTVTDAETALGLDSRVRR
jgi:hypothetical protein